MEDQEKVESLEIKEVDVSKPCEKPETSEGSSCCVMLPCFVECLECLTCCFTLISDCSDV